MGQRQRVRRCSLLLHLCPSRYRKVGRLRRGHGLHSDARSTPRRFAEGPWKRNNTTWQRIGGVCQPIPELVVVVIAQLDPTLRANSLRVCLCTDRVDGQLTRQPARVAQRKPVCRH